METKYNVLIPHHFNNIDNDYDTIYQKFIERINRLDKVLYKSKVITFVYKPTIQTKDFSEEEKKKFGVNMMKKNENRLKQIIRKKYKTKVLFMYL